MKIMKKFLFLKICLFALYSPTIFAITCSTGSGGGGSSSGPYSWTQATSSATFSARYGHSSVVFKGRMWVIGGDDGAVKNDVYRSSVDGKTWDKVRGDGDANGFTARRNHESVVFDDDKGEGEKIWVIGGNAGADKKDVWSSTNGKTWSQATTDTGFPPRQWFSSVVFGDGNDEKIWVMGGLTGFSRGQGNVWNSSDGINWNKAVDSTLFKKRYNQSSVVFDEKIWVIGGFFTAFDDSFNPGSRKDVFSSANGISWKLETGSAKFGELQSHESVVFDDGSGSKMWTIAGANNSGSVNKVWSSADGVTWDESTATVGFTARSGHTSLVFNNSIWVIGGNDGNTYFGDVWSYSND
jgi:dihydrofolate reductase